MAKKKLKKATRSAQNWIPVFVPGNSVTEYNRTLGYALQSGFLNSKWIKRIVRDETGWKVYLGQ